MRHPSYRYIDRTRLRLGFLLAPALVPVSTVALIIGISQIVSMDCPIGLGVFMIAVVYLGTPLSYVGAVLFWLPYVSLMENGGQLGFRTIMVPPLALCLASPTLLFLLGMIWPGFVLILLFSLPGLVLFALCFYFIVVWRSAVLE